MAEAAIRNDQILEPTLFEVQTQNALEFEKALKGVKDGFTSIISESAKASQGNTFETVEDLRNMEQAINNVKKSADNLNKVRNEELKLQERLKKLQAGELDEKLKLQEQIRRETKARRDEIKAKADEGNAYKKLTKEVNALSDEYKRLAAEQGTNSEAAQKALAAFTKANDKLEEINKSAKDGRRNVGRYRESLEGLSVGGFNVAASFGAASTAAKAFLANPVVAAVAAISAGLLILGRAFQKSETGAKLLNKAAAITEGLFAGVVRIVDSATQSLISFTQDPVEGLKNLAFNIFDILILARLEAILNYFVIIKDAVQGLIEQDWEKLGGLAERSVNNFVQLTTGVRDATKAFSDFTSEVSKGAVEFDALNTLTINTRKENRLLAVQLARTTAEYEKLTAAADSDGIALKERIALTQAAAEVQKEAADQELQIARNNLNLINAEVQARRGQMIPELLDEQVQARVAFIEAQKNATNALFEIQELEIRNRLDYFDQTEDDLVDFRDRQKSINEDIVGDETATLEARQAAYQENLVQGRRQLTASVQLIEDTANELRRIRGQEGEIQINFEDLIDLDPIELNRALDDLQLVERQRKRILELLKEEQQFRRDNINTQKELNQVEQETKRITDDIISQRIALAKASFEFADAEKIREQLAKQRRQNEVDALRAEIQQFEEGSQKRIELERQLNDILLDIQLEKLDKEKEERDKARKEEEESTKESIAKRTELERAAIEQVSNLIKQNSEERLTALDEQINASLSRQEQLAEAAEQRGLEASESLALEQQRQRELELQRQRQLKEQQQFELALAAIQTYQQKVRSGDKNALTSTAVEMLALESFTKTLVGFFEGTEDTGKAGVLSDKHGKITGYTHENERVVPKKWNAMIPSNMSNFELARVAQDYAATGGQTVDTSEVFEQMNMQLKGVNDKLHAIEYRRELTIDDVLGVVKESFKKGTVTKTRISRIPKYRK